jgi:4-diphosphocytidyl-2-C-methyl-D-erythritol kinase
MILEAFAKVNLSLRVQSRDASGMHPLRSLVRSVDWGDDVQLEEADADAITVTGDPEVPADEENLAWRAVEAVRVRAAAGRPLALSLVKRIPSAAGLGGGSADAAAALVLAARFAGLPADEPAALAAGLGADVPFCLVGGAAFMEGYGERLSPAPTIDDFALAVVVPPFRLATAAVYRRWDDLGEPEGPAPAERTLPMSLRGAEPLGNDLFAAAVHLAPELGDWAADLARSWGVPVAMSGSGPALYGYFPALEEARDAAAAAPPGARGARGCAPAAMGWREGPAGTLP